MHRLALLILLAAALVPGSAQAETWTGSVTVSEDLQSMTRPSSSDAADRVVGTFTLGVEDVLRTDDHGNQEVTGTPTGADVRLEPTAYPPLFDDPSDPDCTYSRSWSGITFNGAPSTVGLVKYAYEDGVKREDRAEVRLFTGGPEGAAPRFGYDYVESAGYDASCDQPYKDDLPLFQTVLGNYSFQRSYTLPLTRDADGRIYIRGTVQRQVRRGLDDANQTPILANGEGMQTVTVDLTGLTGLPATVPPDPVVLRLVAAKFPPGNGTLKAAGVTCHGGNQNCSVTVERGSTIRVVADAQTGSMTHGLYGCDQNLGLACTVHMSGDRTVTAYFGEDPEILDPTLLTPDQKIDLAQRGADAATEGAVGCVAGAIVIGTGGAAAAAEVALLGSTTVGKIFTDCAMGAVLTGALGMLLKVDPPDPDFRNVGYPEALPAAKEKRCRLRRGCKPLTQAARRIASAARRSASLTEAAAVAGNRYGNAINARDARVQHLQGAAFTVLLDLAADVDTQRAAHSRKLATLLRKRGLRRLRVNVPTRVKTPTAALDRLVRKRLATSRADAKRLVLGVKPRRKPVDVLKTLRAPARVGRARAALANLRAADLPLLVLAIADQERVRTAALDGALQAVASCDEAAAAGVRSALAALPAEPALIAGRALEELARRAALPGCTA